MRVEGLSFSYPDRRVLTNVSFVASPGERIGLIGENGSGKSTLLKMIGGTLEPHAGEVTVSGVGGYDPVIGLLHQETPFLPTATIAETLEMAVIVARKAAAAVSDIAQELAAHPEEPAVSAAYSQALEAAERLDAWQVDAQISTTMAGLGLGDLDRSRLTSTLSGGQRARLSLARLLLKAPDLLLLDEPTNHLDDQAADYLTGILGQWKGPVILTSHDRAFLDEVATSVLDLDPSPIPNALADPLATDGPPTGIGLTRHTGKYSDYLSSRAEARARWQHQYLKEQAQLSRLRAAVAEQQVVGHSGWRPRTEVRAAQKFYADRNAKVVSRRVNDVRTRLKTLEQQQIRKPPQELNFRGLTADHELGAASMAEPALVATEVTMTGRLSGTSLIIGRGEKWLITGANGSGKSTLLNILTGNLVPTSGTVTVSDGLRIGILSQETALPLQAEGTPGLTAAEAYAEMVGPEVAARVPLGAFGLIFGRDEHRTARNLSVGQQRRLALAAVLADPPDILLLDEPTNHLSLSLITDIEEAIPRYPGAVVVASHDRWLRDRWEGRRMELPEPK